MKGFGVPDVLVDGEVVEVDEHVGHAESLHLLGGMGLVGAAGPQVVLAAGRRRSRSGSTRRRR